MGLLDIPTELFDQILFEAFRVRGLKRGVRLMLVNKLFARRIMQVVHRHRLLDRLFSLPRIHTRFYSPKVMASYLQYRVSQEPDHGNPMLNCIKEIAMEIHLDRVASNLEHSSLESCIAQLCSVSMIRSDEKLSRFQQIFEQQEKLLEEDYNGRLFGAALCTNTLNIVRRCIGKDPELLVQMDRFTRCDLFSPHLELAAQYGDEALLEFLLTSQTTNFNRKLRALLFVRTARANRIELLDFVYNFKRTETPWDFGQQASDHQYEAIALYEAVRTTSFETLKYIHELRKVYPTWPKSPIFRESLLADCAMRGFADSTAYWLSQGADAQGMPNMNAPYITNHPIIRACKSSSAQIAVVDLLIKHGADPSVTIATAASRGRTSLVRELLERRITPVKALTGAAKGPYLDVVRLLLDAGVDVNESTGEGSPLASAIALEHTELFRFLIKRGADLHAHETAESCVTRARADGLESMLELLRENGVHVEEG
ncbi:ankyrin repeat-containing domain protein [Phaeosphaeria sp. MPI-PUGE-AT-0046c]|nr:ankyrin repeat-containing domain protein [Phaeosphaeria sp. MPI-PUGE-AT-0046c]